VLTTFTFFTFQRIPGGGDEVPGDERRVVWELRASTPGGTGRHAIGM